MPLAFHSLSHGQVAFGFFNIESDMLLLEHTFFFSTVFCEHLSRVSARPEGEAGSGWFPGYAIDRAGEIGDLMGAIHGIRYSGFIGDLYRRFPFPDDPKDFKQNPEGVRTQGAVKDLIARYGRPVEIPFASDPDGLVIALGEYRFDRASFHELLDYVWRGGYPRWRDETRPGHVLEMKRSLSLSGKPWLNGLVFKE